MENVNERINVIMKFSAGGARPITFEWRGKEYQVQRVALMFDRENGGRRYTCFSVDTGGMVTELVMDRQDWSWRITKCAPSYM